jgi:histidinol-phosphate aminotransferase
MKMIFDEFIKPYVKSIQPYIPGRPVADVKRELGLRHVVKLASNENPYPPSPRVQRAMIAASLTVNCYPDSACHDLREALIRKLKIKPGQIIFGNGSDELIVLAIRALVSEGDEVLIAKPSFLIYRLASGAAGAEVKEIPLRNFHYDLEAMSQAITPKTRIIFLGNPDNPAGTYFTQQAMEDFLSRVPPQTLVFIDEAYYEYVQAKDYVNSLGLLRTHPNVMVSRTFSKLYGLAGLRIGYAIAEEELIGYCERLREPFNVNSVAQAAALACLKDTVYYGRIIKDVEIQRRYLYEELDRCGVHYQPSFANFILVSVDSLPANVLAEKLLRCGVIVRDLTPWGLRDYIRVSIGAAAENRKFITALRKCLQP